MRELHVVALSEDGQHLLLAASPDATRGGFRVRLDARLAAAVRGDLPRAGEDAPRDSSLTPREIQARLRAGQSPEQIAADEGVPVSRVERFAGPVLSERQGVVERARAAVLVRGRRGPSTAPLGEAVDLHLAEVAGLRPESVLWTASRPVEGPWLVELSFTARARRRVARWTYDPPTRALSAVDAASAALGHVDASPPRAPARRAAGAARSTASAGAGRARTKGGAGVPPSRQAVRTSPASGTAAGASPAPSGTARASSAVPARVAPSAPQSRRSASGATAGGTTVTTPAGGAAGGPPAAARRVDPPAAGEGKPRPAARQPKPRSPAREGKPPALRVVPADERAPARSAPARARQPARTRQSAQGQPRAQGQPAQGQPAQGQPRAQGQPAQGQRRAQVPAWADVLLSTAPLDVPAGPGDR